MFLLSSRTLLAKDPDLEAAAAAADVVVDVQVAEAVEAQVIVTSESLGVAQVVVQHTAVGMVVLQLQLTAEALAAHLPKLLMVAEVRHLTVVVGMVVVVDTETHREVAAGLPGGKKKLFDDALCLSGPLRLRYNV